MEFAKYIDPITQVWTDVSGNTHVADPLQYLHVYANAMSEVTQNADMMKQLMKLPADAEEIRQKAKKVAAKGNELVPYQVNGGRKASKVPVYHFYSSGAKKKR